MNKVIVLGGGFVGTKLAQKLSTDFDVTVVTRSSLPTGSAPPWSHRLVDISDIDQMRELQGPFDKVVFAAQSPDYRSFPEKGRSIFETNVSGLFNALDSSRVWGANHFIYLSSGGIYGAAQESFSENDQFNIVGDLGFYLTSKFCGELMCRSFEQFFELTMVRPFFVFGPGQSSKMFIPRMIDAVQSGETIYLDGSSGFVSNPIYIDDLISGLAGCLQRGIGGLINMGGKDVTSLREICEIIGAACGKVPQFDVRASTALNIVADISRMCELGLTPGTSLEKGLRETIEA